MDARLNDQTAEGGSGVAGVELEMCRVTQVDALRCKQTGTYTLPINASSFHVGGVSRVKLHITDPDNFRAIKVRGWVTMFRQRPGGMLYSITEMVTHGHATQIN